MTTLSRDRISWRSWTWIAWGQHQTSISIATGVTLFVGYCIGTNAFDFMAGVWPYAPTVLSTLVAAFWAAPMVAREFEDGTNRFAWSQDASPARWVAGQAVALVVIASGLVAILNAAVLAQINGKVFTSELFEANPLLHTTYVLFGFALGLALGTWLRQTPGAIAGTLVVFLVVRVLIATSVRMHLVPTQTAYTDYSDRAPWAPIPTTPEGPPGAYVVSSGYTGIHGGDATVSVAQAQDCAGAVSPVECLHHAGISGHFTEFQPLHTMPVLQAVEGLIYVALAVPLFLFVLARLRARRRV